jgi:hypothetical protein
MIAPPKLPPNRSSDPGYVVDGRVFCTSGIDIRDRCRWLVWNVHVERPSRWTYHKGYASQATSSWGCASMTTSSDVTAQAATYDWILSTHGVVTPTPFPQPSITN